MLYSHLLCSVLVSGERLVARRRRRCDLEIEHTAVLVRVDDLSWHDGLDGGRLREHLAQNPYEAGDVLGLR